MDLDKRQIRKHKRLLKRAGGKQRRRRLKRVLTENPEEAHHAASEEFDFGKNRSADFNGLDRSPGENA